MVTPMRSPALLALMSAACYGDMTSTQPAGDRFEGTPIDPSVELGCADPVEATEDGHHYEGMACLTCHNGATAPAFTLGGTVYADPEGTTELDGLNVSLIDAAGARVDLVSGLNGNFYSTDAITFPVTAYVSACPDVVPMPILLTLGDCNSCHVAGDRITFSP
jgi:hypothetical protein